MLKVEVVKLTHFVDTFLLKYISNSLWKWNDQNDPTSSEREEKSTKGFRLICFQLGEISHCSLCLYFALLRCVYIVYKGQMS